MAVRCKLKFTSKSNKEYDNLQNKLLQKKVCEQIGKNVMSRNNQKFWCRRLKVI